jgi:hypothetical protein
MGCKSHRAIKQTKQRLSRADYQANKEFILKSYETKSAGWIAEQINGTTSGVRRILRIFEGEKDED